MTKLEIFAAYLAYSVLTKQGYILEMLLPKNKQQRLHYLPPSPERAKLRSETFPGIARAMAEQWGGAIEKGWAVVK
ncbi:MAG: hypothetical protein AAB649_07655 [Patescibacteria group bacterium]